MVKAVPAWLAAAKGRVEAQEKLDTEKKAARAKKRATERARPRKDRGAAAPARTKEDFAARLDAALGKPARREKGATALPRLTPRSGEEATPEPARAEDGPDDLDRAAASALRATEQLIGTVATAAPLDEDMLDREAEAVLRDNERLRGELDGESEDEVSSPRDLKQWLQDIIDDQPSRDPRVAEAWAVVEKEDGTLPSEMPDKAALKAAGCALDDEAARRAGVEVDGFLDEDDEDDEDDAALALERKLDRRLTRSVKGRLDDLAGACRARVRSARTRAEDAAKKAKVRSEAFLTSVDDDEEEDGPTRPVTPRSAWAAELRTACDEGHARISSRRAELRARPR